MPAVPSNKSTSAAAAAADSVGVMVEIAPGKRAMMKVPRQKVGMFGLVKVDITADGAPRIVWKNWHTRVRLSRDLPGKLGLDLSDHIIRVLIYAGLVAGERVSPSCTLVDLDSLAAHMEATSGDGARAYWNEARCAAYSEADRQVHNREGFTERPRRKKPAPAKAPPARRATAAKAPPKPLKPAPPASGFTQPDLF